MKEITRADAIRIFDRATDKDDPFWERLVEDFCDDSDDYDAPLPLITDVFEALGVTNAEYVAATRPPQR